MEAKQNTLICSHCGSFLEEGDYDLDKAGQGFWCECCDMYNYFTAVPEDERHHFELALEVASNNELRQTADVKFKRQLSPLRYPGGKSKIIPYVHSRLNRNKARTFVEPYAGGASVGLSLLEAGAIEKLHLNDLDYGIYALFTVIFSDPGPILERLDHVTPTHEMYFESQRRILSNHHYDNLYDAAWDMLIVNRLSFSGISKANPLGGKNGTQKELLSRWNPATLKKRIERLWALRDAVSVSNRDALEVIEEFYWDEETTLFIDPPYVDKGPVLYTKSYSDNNHVDLCVLLESLYATCPGADIQLYYDNSDLVKDIYSLPEIIEINRRYSA